ncbi:hypothetical protein [Pseudodesulfovibrio pelocollis]|uniref:hypothetical protein n=1 Tax=Pseudodesulfovibrio pelocollis TaxID=3051432 RepID=UPI00255AE8ED|nr:hypothetical protein [Pseudodesulfovibrio sp. SB368]
MLKYGLAVCALVVCLTLAGCGDNGPWPTMMGKIQKDYSFEAADSWQDATGDTMSLLMASFMAEEYVIEHTFMPAGHQPGGGYPPAVMFLVDRGGPYSRDQIEEQYREYLSRPVVTAPSEVRHSLDLDAGRFRIEEMSGDSAGGRLTILERQYTRKGYVATLAICPADDGARLAEIEALAGSVTINPAIVYADSAHEL